LLIGLVSLAAQAWSWGNNSTNWQTMVFTVLTFSQLAHVLAIRSDSISLWHQGLFSNLPLLGAVTMTVVLHLLVVYLPVLNPIFSTQPLAFGEMAVCVLLALIVLLAVEIEKWLRRKNLIYSGRV
jgi:Ca2+-transporting ATPase